MNEREGSDAAVGDCGVGSGHNAEMFPCAINRAVSVVKEVSAS